MTLSHLKGITLISGILDWQFSLFKNLHTFINALKLQLYLFFIDFTSQYNYRSQISLDDGCQKPLLKNVSYCEKQREIDTCARYMCLSPCCTWWIWQEHVLLSDPVLSYPGLRPTCPGQARHIGLISAGLLRGSVLTSQFSAADWTVKLWSLRRVSNCTQKDTEVLGECQRCHTGFTDRIIPHISLAITIY